MVCCAVMGCSSNNNKKSKNCSSCRYFSFPAKDKKVCDLWVQKCYRMQKFNIKTASICSRHFLDSDYCLRERLLKLPQNKWRLKSDAVPSLNLMKPAKAVTYQIKREKRILLKNVLEEHKLENSGTMDVDKTDDKQQLISIKFTPLTEPLSSNKFKHVSTQTSLHEDHELLELVHILQDENMRLKELLGKERDAKKSIEQIFIERDNFVN